ncbi:MAG: S-layer homology domain-containing protein, partial [Clostridiales Family XIII bacterium]|nr:S-layer homology domain-containing protein [Clostridiales Family XIII bacterium]
YGDGTFRPGQGITRSEFTAIAARFDDLTGDGESPFGDVAQGYWAYGQILSAYGKGWINGYPDGNFKPEGAITRAEAITIVDRILGRTAARAETPKPVYSDLPEGHWAFSAVMDASGW